MRLRKTGTKEGGMNMVRILIITYPYSTEKITFDDLIYEYPGIEIDLDADREEIRIYKSDGCKDPVERLFGIGKTRIER
jgi:hypothetical protein